jgi:hypothetical protein
MRALVVRCVAFAAPLLVFGATFAVAPATAAPAPAPPPHVVMRWKLALDLRTRPNRNPFPSYLGGAPVWSLRESRSLTRDGNYKLLPSFASKFGSAGIEAWHGSTAACVPLPAIGVNVTTKPHSVCTGVVPALAAFVRPDATHMPVVAWTSPFSGTVSISHDAISDVDVSCGDGVTYYVDFGTAQLATMRIPNGDGNVLPPITQSIKQGQSLYFIVDAGPRGNSSCDTTQLQITVDQLSS